MSAEVVALCHHEPSVVITRSTIAVESVTCQCRKCGRLFTDAPVLEHAGMWFDAESGNAIGLAPGSPRPSDEQ